MLKYLVIGQGREEQERANEQAQGDGKGCLAWTMTVQQAGHLVKGTFTDRAPIFPGGNAHCTILRVVTDIHCRAFSPGPLASWCQHHALVSSSQSPHLCNKPASPVNVPPMFCKTQGNGGIECWIQSAHLSGKSEGGRGSPCVQWPGRGV